MEALKKETVHMKDPDYVEKILNELINGGPSKLQVVSDFDKTLTRAHKDGVICDSTYGILEHSTFLSEDYRNKSLSLFLHYHPIEIDPNFTKEEKTPLMIEWFSKMLNLLPTSGFSKDIISDVVKASSACFRDNCSRLFQSLNNHNVPLLIFSAGVGDILMEILRQHNMFLPNMKVIANFMDFDEKNKCVEFKGNLIHVFNKNESSIKNSDYFNTLKSRNNIILLGDSLGDLDMSNGVENVNVILKIGFLNHRIKDNLKDYVDAYDIVLTDDQTMDVVNGLLQNILG